MSDQVFEAIVRSKVARLEKQLSKAQESATNGWNAYEDLRKASDEMIIELRQQLAAVTKTLDETEPWRELQSENKQLKEQLAECERERDQQIKECNEFWGKKSDADYWEILRLASAAAVLREFDNPHQVGDVWQWIGPAPEDIDAAFAKLGADKTGEV